MSDICFNPSTFYTYLFLLFCIILYIIFIGFPKEHFSDTNLYSHLSKEDLIKKVDNLQKELFDIKLAEQKCQGALEATKQQISNVNGGNANGDNIRDFTRQRFLNKIIDPLSPPENVYFGGSFNSPGYDSYTQYQMIGYLSGDGVQYPVFGRDKYSGRSDKQEYYLINEGRNRIKIPFKTVNYNELYDGDSVTVPEVGSRPLIFTKYETEGVRYNPNIF
jgi:hypothetical protein